VNKEIQYLITTLQNTLHGEPWYGRSAFGILEAVDPSMVYIKPEESEHSMIELLYHMITWAEFTIKRVEREQIDDMAAFEKLDWREIKPAVHTWEKGLEQFRQIHEQLIERLHTKDDGFLGEQVEYREYNFRYLLNGLIHHNIYHLGQVMYVSKLISARGRAA
jgi:uncharacterized damage-inducible protein DinB